MTPEEERFVVGLCISEFRVEFYITSRSTRGKRWAFFGLLTMIILLLTLQLVGPELQELLT